MFRKPATQIFINNNVREIFSGRQKIIIDTQAKPSPRFDSSISVIRWLYTSDVCTLEKLTYDSLADFRWLYHKVEQMFFQDRSVFGIIFSGITTAF